MSLTSRSCAAAVLCATGLGTTAHAGGVLVRLDADRTIDGEVFVDLVPPTGDRERIQLQDDGQQPDVTAGDGRWAGAAFFPLTDVTVTLVIAGESIDGGVASWSAADIPRDLDLSLRGDVLTVKAREANPHGQGNGAPGAGEGGSPSAAATGVDDDAREGVWLIGVGALLFVVLGGAWTMVRSQRRARRGPIEGVTRQSPGGFAGPQSPALDDGLVFWRMDGGEPADILGVLVDTLARHHGVLVVSEQPPDTLARSGRRIFRSAVTGARKVGDALEAIHRDPREPAVVVFVGVAGTSDDWADRDDELPLGSGGIVLLPAGADAPEASHSVRMVSPGLCAVESTDGGAAFWLGDRARWPTHAPAAVVDP